MFRTAVFVALCSLLCSHAAAQDRQFAFSAGAAYSRLADVDFEVVTSLAAQDLFSQVRAQESTFDFAVFLSQRLWNNDDLRAYGSIGTGVNAPGVPLYLGGSLGVSRTLVTLGVATKLLERGIGPAPDDVFRGTGDRTLFASLDRERKWALFVALSIAAIQ